MGPAVLAVGVLVPGYRPWGNSALPLPLYLTPSSCVGQDKVLKELDAAIDVETIKLRELRYKMVDAGVYKSWCAPRCEVPRAQAERTVAACSSS